MFRLKYLKNNEMGISPVVGVILMVAITVILVGVVGTAVLDIAQNSTNSGNVTAGATVEQSPEGVTVQYTQEGNSDGIVVLVGGQEVDGAVLEGVGDRVTVTAGEGEKVTAVGYKGSPDNRETDNTIVSEEARSDTTGGSDPTVVSGGTGSSEGNTGTNTVSGSVAINPDISGATVELVDNTGSVLKTTTTDSNGEYSFDVEDTSNKSVSITVEGFTDDALDHPLYASAKQDVGESNTVDFNFQNEYQATVDGSTVLVSNDISETGTNTIGTVEQLKSYDKTTGVNILSDLTVGTINNDIDVKDPNKTYTVIDSVEAGGVSGGNFVIKSDVGGDVTGGHVIIKDGASVGGNVDATQVYVNGSVGGDVTSDNTYLNKSLAGSVSSCNLKVSKGISIGQGITITTC